MHAASLEVGEVESPSLAQVSEDVSYLVEGIDQSGRRCWHGAEAAEDGGTRPRNASTCLLWCAIALGALVRGCPLTNVGPICHVGRIPQLHAPFKRGQLAEMRVGGNNFSSSYI